LTNDLSNGLFISVFGLLIKFFVMGIFILMIISLKRIFPYKAQADEGEDEESANAEQYVALASTGEEEERDIAAAITVAISFLRLRDQSSLGNTLKECRGSWWSANRRNTPDVLVRRMNYQRNSISIRKQG
jgi:hypothetical protein